MSSLKLSGVNKIYHSGEAALYDVNLETGDREFIAVVGGEKCGKTTLLRIIAGIEDASDGSVFIDGKDVTDVEPKDRDIAMVFRENTLYPALTVFDNMAFGLRMRKAPQALIEQRVKAVSNILGLNEILFRKPKALTAAAKQRVAIGRAIAREPKLYLFDEPLAGLDDKLKADMLNIIVNLQARMQGTFIYSTKNIVEAMTVATRIVVLKNGLVQQIDTPANLYDYPANVYVAFLIGSPTINFVKEVKIQAQGGGYVAVTPIGNIALPENIVKRFTEISEYQSGEKSVWLGIRPEDISIAADGEISGTVEKVEEIDGTTFAEVKLSDGTYVVVTANADTVKGSEVKLALNAQRLYVFDGETRLTALSRDSGYKATEYADANFAPMPFEDEKAVTEKLKPKKEDKKKKR